MISTGRANKLCRRLVEPLGHPVAVPIVKGDVLAFEVAEVAQPVPEGVPPGCIVDDSDPRDLRRLLRAQRQRPTVGRMTAADPMSLRYRTSDRIQGGTGPALARKKQRQAVAFLLRNSRNRA